MDGAVNVANKTHLTENASFFIALAASLLTQERDHAGHAERGDLLLALNCVVRPFFVQEMLRFGKLWHHLFFKLPFLVFAQTARLAGEHFPGGFILF